MHVQRCSSGARADICHGSQSHPNQPAGKTGVSLWVTLPTMRLEKSAKEQITMQQQRLYCNTVTCIPTSEPDFFPNHPIGQSLPCLIVKTSGMPASDSWYHSSSCNDPMTSGDGACVPFPVVGQVFDLDR